MECKICNKQFKGIIGLNTHLRTHEINYFDYHIKYENFIIPKCQCGKNRKKHKIDFKFYLTCGNITCVKNVQRDKRIKWLKENPEKTAWRLSNMSYLEKIFKERCEALELHKKHLIIREKSFFPYFIDFAFENEKIAVEIDGSQHNLSERIESDLKKDNLLLQAGWRILRFTAREIKTNINSCFDKLLSFIQSDIKYEKVGIYENIDLVKLKKEELNKERQNNNGLTNAQLQDSLSQRKVERPPYEKLIQEIKELGYSATGRKYNVSDNSIRKWIKNYEKYSL